MANNNQPLCTLCKNTDICKYSEEYQKMFGQIKTLKHPLFEHRLTCNKFIDARPPVIETFATAACSARQ